MLLVMHVLFREKSVFAWFVAPVAVSTLLLLPSCSSDSDDGGPDNTGGASGASTGGSSAGGSSGGGAGGTSGGSGTDASTQGVTCEQICPMVFAAGCMNGPPSADICVVLCNNITSADSGTCNDAFETMLACASTDTTVTCTTDGDATSDDCPDEFAAIVPCLPNI